MVAVESGAQKRVAREHWRRMSAVPLLVFVMLLYVAFAAAMRAAKEHGSLPPPKHILNAQTKLMEEEGYGRGYVYDHAVAEAFSGQNYFPDAMARQQFYDPQERGFEREIKRRLEHWAKRRGLP